jgi:hypothetical protein
MNTKLILVAGLATGLALQLCPSALADYVTTTTSSGTLNELIPDGNSNGIVSQITMSTPGNQIANVVLSVNVTGDPVAWNGDYYAYLEYDNTPVVVLMDSLGAGSFGSPGDGFNVTFDQTAANISTALGLNSSSPLTGTYAPQIGNLGSLNGLDPNGTWTLFIADQNAGDVGQLASWSLSVTSVPDHASTLLLLSLGLGMLGLYSIRQPRPVRISTRGK